MNQEKIGKFILKLRKEKKMTQKELADKLNVTDRAVSHWENGRRLPDVVLYKTICELFDITVNELLSGEKIKKDEYQNKLEENIINTIDYSTRKINIIRNNLGIVLYLGNNPENGIAHLNEEQINLIADIGKEALNRYLDILETKNNEYKKMETEFLNKMNEFGEKHDMSEKELVNFADSALKMGYNVADIETQEELDEVFKKVYPES